MKEVCDNCIYFYQTKEKFVLVYKKSIKLCSKIEMELAECYIDFIKLVGCNSYKPKEIMEKYINLKGVKE